MNLQILAPGEEFSAAREIALEWLFSGMDTNMIDKFVLGLKCFSTPWTILPEASVDATIRSGDMFVIDMIDRFVHRLK